MAANEQQRKVSRERIRCIFLWIASGFSVRSRQKRVRRVVCWSVRRSTRSDVRPVRDGFESGKRKRDPTRVPFDVYQVVAETRPRPRVLRR